MTKPVREPPARIRRAATGDARSIAEIGVLGWQAAYRGLLPDDFLAGLSVDARAVAWTMVLEADGDDASPSWVAERDGQVVVYLSTGPPRDEDVPLPAAEVYAVYILPAVWRSGLGRALLDAALTEWRARDAGYYYSPAGFDHRCRTCSSDDARNCGTADSATGLSASAA